MKPAELYAKHYSGEWSRMELFKLIGKAFQPDRVLYPGCYVHVTPSFVFPWVRYVDLDRRAKRFFAQEQEVIDLVSSNRVYDPPPKFRFHHCDYNQPLPEAEGSFQLLVSLYAGVISKPCKHYLAVGGILLANNSHGDAGIAHLDNDFRLVGVVTGNAGAPRLSTSGLDGYFIPKQKRDISEQQLLELGRGIGYTRSASGYLFERIG